MAALDMAIKSGIKLVGGKGTSVLRSVTENGTVVQKAVSKEGVTKVVTFAEGSPVHKLGITDSIYVHQKGYKPEVTFYKNPDGECHHLDSWRRGDGYVQKDDFFSEPDAGMIFEGTVEKAKSFLEAIKELVRNGGKIS